MGRSRGLLALFVTLTLLAACGRQAAAPPTVAPTTAAPPTAAPPTPAAATATRPAPAAATATQPAPAAATATQPAPAAAGAGALAQGRTPEGYPLLGDPNAPVTLTMYSDFL
jgi:protein-disulfide isomerase